MMDEDRIAYIFEDKEIFLTGSSGFMGKIFVEKLLRATKIKKIILLLRDQKGIKPEERIVKLLNDAIFEKLKHKMTIEEIHSKLDFVAGDCQKLNLGLSSDDRKKVIENVSIFYHFAATTRFDEKMKKAVEINVRGTREMIKLALECKNLEIFGHISTCFCHVHEKVLLEKPYDPPMNPHEMIEISENMANDFLEKYSKILLKELKIPNNYTFTKSLAEALVVEAKVKQNLPSVIFRPSIVISTLKDPIPGYIDNTNGLIGLILAAGKGVAGTIFVDGKNFADLIPCDVAINMILMGTWNCFKEKEKFIIHLVLPRELRQTWQEISNLSLNLLNEIPLNQMFWSPNCTLTTCKWLYLTRLFIFQNLPATIIDFFLGIFGYKKVLKKVVTHIRKGNKFIEYFANTSWHFDDGNNQIICKRLNDIEEKSYDSALKSFSFEKYYENVILGIRRFILNTKDEQLPAARRQLKIMKFLNKIAKFIYYFGFLFWIFQLKDDFFINFIQILFCLFMIALKII